MGAKMLRFAACILIALAAVVYLAPRSVRLLYYKEVGRPAATRTANIILLVD